MLTDAFWQSINEVLRHQQVSERHQATQLLWKPLHFVFRYIQTQQAFHAAHLLKIRAETGGKQRYNNMATNTVQESRVESMLSMYLQHLISGHKTHVTTRMFVFIQSNSNCNTFIFRGHICTFLVLANMTPRRDLSYLRVGKTNVLVQNCIFFIVFKHVYVLLHTEIKNNDMKWWYSN